MHNTSKSLTRFLKKETCNKTTEAKKAKLFCFCSFLLEYVSDELKINEFQVKGVAISNFIIYINMISLVFALLNSEVGLYHEIRQYLGNFISFTSTYKVDSYYDTN